MKSGAACFLALALVLSPAHAENPNQELMQVQKDWFFHRYTRAATRLRAIKTNILTPQQRFDWLLLKDQSERLLGETSRTWLDQASPLALDSPSNRLRLCIRQYWSHQPGAWKTLEEQWSSRPVSALACDYYLARADFFSNNRDDRGEEECLEMARSNATTDLQRASAIAAIFAFDLNQSRWRQAEDEIEKFAELTGATGALDALWMQAKLANRRGNTRLAQGLFLHLADLQRANHEPFQEAQFLFWTLDIQKFREKSDPSVAYGSPHIVKRLWELTRPLPPGSVRLSQLISISRVCGSQPALQEALSLYRRLSPATQLRWFDQMVGRLQRDGRLEEGLQVCNAALRLRPDWAVALKSKGEVQERRGDTQAALECYVRGLQQGVEGSETEMAYLAASLLSVLRAQNRSQDMLRIAREVCQAQSSPNLRAIFLQRGLLGIPSTNSVVDQQFRSWCWQELYGLLDRLNDEGQLQATLTLTNQPPPQATLAPVLARGLELTERQRAEQEREQNWGRFARVCQARSRLLEAAGRSAEAVDCLLAAEKKLTEVDQPGRIDSVLESLVWAQSRAGRMDDSEATALRLLERSTNAELRAEMWLHVAVCRESKRPEAALQAFAQALGEAPDQATRERILTMQGRTLAQLQRWQAVLDLFPPAQEKPGLWQRSRGLLLAQAYEALGKLDLAEQRFRKLVSEASDSSAQQRAQDLTSLAEFLDRHARPGGPELVERCYREYLEQLAGASRHRIVVNYCRVLLDQGRSTEALQILQQQTVPREALGNLIDRSELQPWLATQIQSVQPAGTAGPTKFWETLTKIRSLRRDLDSHPFFQASQLELIQRHLGPRQLLLTVCQAGPELFVLGVDRDQTYVYQSSLEGGWLTQQIAEFAKSPEARAYLNKRLLEPIAEWLPNKEILWVPLAEGWYVPWELLGELGLKQPFSRVGSADLLHLAGGDWRPFQLTDSLALGAPEEADLSGARRELESIAARLARCRLAVGPQANLQALSPAPSLIHIASHSQIVGRDPDASFVQFHKSRLSLRNIYGLALQPHSLVVLSTCSSALGQDRPAGEPLSLAGAFAAAGSQTQISALWPVDDLATVQFFEVFYQQLAAGHSPAQSLLAARQALAQAGSPPQDWAAFVLQGCPD